MTDFLKTVGANINRAGNFTKSHLPQVSKEVAIPLTVGTLTLSGLACNAVNTLLNPNSAGIPATVNPTDLAGTVEAVMTQNAATAAPQATATGELSIPAVVDMFGQTTPTPTTLPTSETSTPTATVTNTPLATVTGTLATPNILPTSTGVPSTPGTAIATGNPTVTPTETLTPAVVETRFIIDRPTDANWPDTTPEAQNKWGAKADMWSRDLYTGQDGKLHWDGFTWRFEGFPLNQGVASNGDGTYTEITTGRLLTKVDEIYNLDPSKAEFFDIKLDDNNPSDYASGYRGSKAPQNPGTLVYGYGTATLTGVEQAVIRKVPVEMCPPDYGAAGKFGAHKDAEMAFQNDARVKNGENKIWLWDEQTQSFYLMDKLVIYDAAVPATHPETSQGAATIYGGTADQWRKDVYMGTDKKAHWDGTWVFEGFPHNAGVPTRVDGMYLRANGTPMTDKEIYNIKAENAKFVNIEVYDGEYATGYRGSKAPTNPGSLDITFDRSTLEGVEQAVIRVPTQDGICVTNPEASAKARAQQMLAEIIANANKDGGFNWNENILRIWNDALRQFDTITKP